jgi:hypothetical protein
MGFNSGKNNLTDLEVESGAASEPVVNIKNTHAGATAGSLRFTKDGASAADDDALGTIDFYGENDAGTPESIQFASITAQSTDITDGAENAEVLIKTYVAGGLQEVARLNPESPTANTFCGGFAHKRPVFDGADVALTHQMSGCIIVIGDGDDILLPTPQPGIHYTFINAKGTDSTLAQITATSDGSSGVRTIIFGQLIDNNGDQVNFADQMKLKFTTDSTVGDRIELVCLQTNSTNGAETWYAMCYSDANDGITKHTS